MTARVVTKCGACDKPIVAGQPYVVRTIHYPKGSVYVAVHERCSKAKR